MTDYIKGYADFLAGHISLKTQVSVVFDCSNGTTAPVLKEIVGENNFIKHRIINGRPDGSFPGHGPNPMEDGVIEQLRGEVMRNRADVGVIFDGDGDRVLFVDDDGEVFDTRDVVFLLSRHFKGKYVVNASIGKRTLGWLLPNLEIVESRTGHYFMMDTMKKENAVLGAEHSGHYYFREFYFSESGILTAIFVINEVGELKKRGIKLSEWRKSIPEYYSTGEISLSIAGADGAIERVEDKFSADNVDFERTDGLTVDGRDFWFNIRASNTEPLLRVNISSRDKEVLEEKREELLKLLQ